MRRFLGKLYVQVLIGMPFGTPGTTDLLRIAQVNCPDCLG